MWKDFLICTPGDEYVSGFENENVDEEILEFTKGRTDLPALIVRTILWTDIIVCEKKEECRPALEEYKKENNVYIGPVDETTVGEFLSNLEENLACDYPDYDDEYCYDYDEDDDEYYDDEDDDE